jgi:Sucrase/ferredoxin-like
VGGGSAANGRESCEAITYPTFMRKRFDVTDGGELSDDDLAKFCSDVRASSPSSGIVDVKQINAQVEQRLQYPTILICSHGGRDQRCGVLGPILQREFTAQLSLYQSNHLGEALRAPTDTSVLSPEQVNVGMISHVGGHKWAGNVILYFPSTWKVVDGKNGNSTEGVTRPSPLAGMGIWYGRVEPKHVQGIIEETVLKGNIIRELFRGGIGRDGQALRLPLQRAAVSRA